jgi:hypothetical protein
MPVERIRELLDVQPFRPFVMHLADGREVPVHHRELIIAAPSGRTLIVVQPEDTMNIIDLLLVTDVEIKRGRNGSSGKRRR